MIDISNLKQYACFGDGDMCSLNLQHDKLNEIQRYFKFEDVMELLKQADNRPSAPLCECEQLFIGCAITGTNCKTRGTSKCK